MLPGSVLEFQGCSDRNCVFNPRPQISVNPPNSLELNDKVIGWPNKYKVNPVRTSNEEPLSSSSENVSRANQNHPESGSIDWTPNQIPPCQYCIPAETAQFHSSGDPRSCGQMCEHGTIDDKLTGTIPEDPCSCVAVKEFTEEIPDDSNVIMISKNSEEVGTEFSSSGKSLPFEHCGTCSGDCCKLPRPTQYHQV